MGGTRVVFADSTLQRSHRLGWRLGLSCLSGEHHSASYLPSYLQAYLQCHLQSALTVPQRRHLKGWFTSWSSVNDGCTAAAGVAAGTVRPPAAAAAALEPCLEAEGADWEAEGADWEDGVEWLLGVVAGVGSVPEVL